VSDKTSSLNTASEKLILEQRKLNEIGDEIKQRLHYFTQAEQLSQRLHSPTLSVASEIFMQTLNSIDECLLNLKSNVSRMVLVLVEVKSNENIHFSLSSKMVLSTQSNINNVWQRQC